ncbi:PilZ domain-containing protein [Novosphingobium sp.]|uniref:PilZ domain-containing protein n=1 Tax=Novosphingobium sp. TaxID=1874826 RepID=UPI00333E3054
MSGGAQLSVTNHRSSARHPVELAIIGEHRRLGDIMLNLINVSTTGFMVRGVLDLGRGERVTIRLPQIGRIEAFLVWNDPDRAGFQFERIVRADDFPKMIKALQPNPRLRSPH